MDVKLVLVLVVLLTLAGSLVEADYIWHYDEIPYEATAKCKRGTSYYSNDPDANNTNISVTGDIDSLLSYDNQTFCYYCVCSVNGRGVGCISRDPWYCEYYRVIRNPEAAQERYYKLFLSERPAYFRTLSFRMRRRMDDGVYALLDIGGDTLCCDHPNGHRRNLHMRIRDQIRQMRRRVPKENMLAGSPRGDYVDFIVNND